MVKCCLFTKLYCTLMVKTSVFFTHLGLPQLHLQLSELHYSGKCASICLSNSSDNSNCTSDVLESSMGTNGTHSIITAWVMEHMTSANEKTPK